MDFLGHAISTDGVRPNADKVSALNDIPISVDLKHLRILLGGLSFFRMSRPKMARRTHAVVALLKKGATFGFLADMEIIVPSLLGDLVFPSVLVFPDRDAFPGLYAPASKRRGTVARCTPRRIPHDASDTLIYLLAGLTHYVLCKHTAKSLPMTADDVPTPPERLVAEQVTTHQTVRGRGDFIAATHQTYWRGLLLPAREREMDLQHSRSTILLYGAGSLIYNL